MKFKVGDKVTDDTLWDGVIVNINQNNEYYKYYVFFHGEDDAFWCSEKGLELINEEVSK